MPKGKACFPVFFVWLFLHGIFIAGSAKAQENTPFKKGTDTAAITREIKSAAYLPDADSAIKRLEYMAQVCIEADYFLGAARCFRTAGGRYFDIGNYPEAFNYYSQSLPFAEKSGIKDQVARCLNCLALIHLTRGEYLEASEGCYKALSVLKNIDSSNYETAISIYTNLTGLSRQLNEKDKQLYYLNMAESIVRKWHTDPDNYIRSLAPILTHKGIYFYENNSDDSATKYFLEVLEVINGFGPGKEIVRTEFQATAYVNLAGIAGRKGDWRTVDSFSRKAIDLELNKNENVVECAYSALGCALWHLKQFNEAEVVLKKGLQLSLVTNHKDLVVAGYYYLSEMYKDTKQYKKALDCMDSLVAIKDTLVSAEKVKAILQVEARYNVAEKDRQITKNELLIAQQKNKITRKNILIGSISAGVCMLALLSTGLYSNSRRKQTEEIRSLKQQNTISILKGVVQGEENERIRLARDLHDGIGGMLSATKMRFMALRHDNEALIHAPRYLEAMGLLDIMGDEIRKTSHNLMPEVLLKQDLADALRTYCNNLQTGTDLHIDFQSFGSFASLPNDFKLNIYRIVQELLKNIQQHAHATYAVVQLMMLEAYLTISVEDNGTGFNTGETKDGIGLHNLKTRVLSQEGHYTLKSEPGKGTTVYIEFSIPGKTNDLPL